jgi:endonuclease YncB( thermonuclease family)
MTGDPMPSYDYAVEVVRVVDGDTLDLRVDLGFHMTAELRFRLLGTDTPERHEAGWHECTEATRAWVAAHAGTLRAETHKADSFGRWLALVYAPIGAGGREYLADVLNALMAAHGWTSLAVR